ncbi:hypothetical protein [Halorussus halobius]|nr:hypothetical protein [Halorussus halobius]
MPERPDVPSNLGVKAILLGIELTLLGRFVFESMALVLVGATLCTVGVFL